MGNTVIVVEHDKAMIEQSDFVVDMGPGAGIQGGEVILSSAPNDFRSIPAALAQKSLTAQYLTGIKKIEIPTQRRQPNGKYLLLEGASGNNLKNVNLSIPLGTMVCITGMSGSGKSTLVNDTLYPLLANHFYHASNIPLEYKSIKGIENIDKVIEIDQLPIGRTPRSNPATYTGLIHIDTRFLYIATGIENTRLQSRTLFFFNVKAGRCEECEGAGIRKIEMNFLPDVYVTCDVCGGRRYNNETLEVKYKGKSIADVLDMTVVEAITFFSEIHKIRRKLQTLSDVGLGYITLGQQCDTFRWRGSKS